MSETPNPHHIGHRHRLRERFAKSGRSTLADYELLELLLTYGIPRIDTKAIAKDLLQQFGTILGVLQQPEHRLIKVNGIGKQTVLFLKVIHGCLTRCMESELEEQPSISGPEDIFAFVRLHWVFMQLSEKPNQSMRDNVMPAWINAL